MKASPAGSQRDPAVSPVGPRFPGALKAAAPASPHPALLRSRYWSLAFAIAIFGTGGPDTLHKVVGIPCAGTALFWAIVLGVVSWQWNRSEGTLSIHSVTTRRREGYHFPAPLALERDEGTAVRGAPALERTA